MLDFDIVQCILQVVQIDKSCIQQWY